MNLPDSTILVVDDDDSLSELYKINLEKLGCNVIAVNNSDDAISLYTQAINSNTPIDIVILDLNIPGSLSGKEIASEIRKIDPVAKLIVSSGNSASPEMTQYQEHGFNAAIEKNFNRANIKQVVEKVLGET